MPFGSDQLKLFQEPLTIVHWLEKPESWMRIAKAAIGTGLILGGAYLLVRVQVLAPIGEKVAGYAGQAAGVAVPEAGAAKAAAGSAKGKASTSSTPAPSPAPAPTPAKGGTGA